MKRKIGLGLVLAALMLSATACSVFYCAHYEVKGKNVSEFGLLGAPPAEVGSDNVYGLLPIYRSCEEKE
jgi:hypothetical protein